MCIGVASDCCCIIGCALELPQIIGFAVDLFVVVRCFVCCLVLYFVVVLCVLCVRVVLCVVVLFCFVLFCFVLFWFGLVWFGLSRFVCFVIVVSRLCLFTVLFCFVVDFVLCCCCVCFDCQSGLYFAGARAGA